MTATTSQNAAALAALKVALPYVTAIASRVPTQPWNCLKRDLAVKDAAKIRAAILALETVTEDACCAS